MQTGTTAFNKQNFWHLLLRRFLAFYLLVFIFPFPLEYLPYFKKISKVYNQMITYLVALIGRHGFHISFPLAQVTNGSGDTTYNYVRLLLFVIIAVVITVVYSISDQRQKHDALILYWLTAYIRFFFALTMIFYGFAKIVRVQFPFPFYSLNETYGESSPLRLMWNFMGYSKAYNFFIGAGEVLAGVLVLFRKTTTLGTLLSIAILSNIVIMNFCFDVPVKIYAAHLLFLAFFIVVPDMKRLYQFFIQNRNVPPASIQPRFKDAKTNTVLYAIKFVLTLAVIYSLIGIIKHRYYFYGDGAFAKTPLLGLYNVETFVKNGDTLQPLITDTSQWRSLNIIYTKQATLKMINDSMKVCNLVMDTAKKKMHLAEDKDSTYAAAFSYSLPDSVHLLLTGKLKEDSVSILLQKQDLQKYRLINRGFHWVNEYPYNR